MRLFKSRTNKHRFRFNPLAICDGNAIGVFELKSQIAVGLPLRTYPLKDESQADSLGVAAARSRTILSSDSPRRGVDLFCELTQVKVDQQDLLRVDVLLSPKPQKRNTLDATYWLDPGLGDVVKRIEFRRTASAMGKFQSRPARAKSCFRSSASRRAGSGIRP